MEYSNPVIKGFYPDPSICRVGSDYYLVTSSFQYFPGVPIFHSTNLINWKKIGYCLTRPSQLMLNNATNRSGIFAPTLRYHEGIFYLITTNVTLKKNFIVMSEDPQREWSDPIWIDGWGGIDPSLFFDNDGKVYITGTNDNARGEELGIYQAEIDLKKGSIIGERKLIWKGTGGSYPEAPHLYKVNGWYYLLIAEGGTEYGHMVTVARSKYPFGPFESCPFNPILTHRSTNHPLQSIGHADIVQYHDGSWWAVFHGTRPISYPPKHHLGRETCLAPIKWTDDGWPIIGYNGRIDTKMDAGYLSVKEENISNKVIEDDFNSDIFSVDWNFIQNPRLEHYSLKERPSWLKMRGTEKTLNDINSPTFIGRRQEHFVCNVSTLLEFKPNKDNEEAGLTVYMNEKHHYEIALTKKNGRINVVLKKTVGDIQVVANSLEYFSNTIILCIQANPEEYKFSFVDPNTGQTYLLGTGLTTLLSTEVAGGFTGVYFGLYATGNGKVCTTPAFFDWFKYIPET
jgi:alpha-N-arabinofuranosidase